jgi:tRNA dimethylallyltransferase
VSEEGASVLVILGPTATGKTAVSIEVARRLDGEIISADSRAFFRGLDIVTAKPTAEECGGIPHHLIDTISIDEEYDAMAFRADVARLVPEIAARRRMPLLVGGGTLYVGAVLGGIFEGPAKDEAFRDGVADVPAEALHKRLGEVDPEAALGIHPNDRLRVVRALEVFEATGRSIVRWQAEARPLPYDFVVFGLKRAKDDHRAAVAERVRRMIERGLVEEVDRLRASGLCEGLQAYRTIGVPEVADYLDGRLTEAEMEATIVRRTWELVRRQTAWFRRERSVLWLEASGRSAENVARDIVERWEERAG